MPEIVQDVKLEPRRALITRDIPWAKRIIVGLKIQNVNNNYIKIDAIKPTKMVNISNRQNH
jgi:hypothetical protein